MWMGQNLLLSYFMGNSPSIDQLELRVPFGYQAFNPQSFWGIITLW